MRCSNCGAEIADNSDYCIYCASPVQKAPKAEEVPAGAEKPERNGFITFWLWFIIVVQVLNIVACCAGLFSDSFRGYRVDDLARVMFVGGLIVSIVNLLGATQLLNWKKSGFWLILGMAALRAVLGAMTMADGSASGMMISLIGPFFGVGILWAVLQISKNGHTCWSLLR